MRKKSRKLVNLRWQLKVFLYYLKNSLIIILKVPFIYKNWAHVIISRFTYKQCIFHLNNGLKFKVRPKKDDRATVNEMFILKPYIRKDFKINNDDIVLDAGAYIGAFTIYAANIAKNGNIYSIEPIKEHFKLLEANIKLNNLKNVILSNLALDSSKGSKNIYISGSMSSFYWSRQNRSQLVKTTTLEDFLAENNLRIVNFLKMDCEGAEFDILLNLNKSVLDKIQKIVLEYHNLSSEKNSNVLKGYLEENGFQVQMSYGEWNGILFAKNNKL